MFLYAEGPISQDIGASRWYKAQVLLVCNFALSKVVCQTTSRSRTRMNDEFANAKSGAVVPVFF